MVVLQKWKAARDDLIDAIDAYLDTTIALESAIAKPWGHFSTDADLEEAIYVVHKKRKSVESRIEDLYDAEIYLDKIRNRSKQRVPINSLPLEILTSIFTLACSSGRPEDASLSFFGTPVRPTPKTLLALTRVCSDWRKIVTNIPSSVGNLHSLPNTRMNLIWVVFIFHFFDRSCPFEMKTECPSGRDLIFFFC